MPHMTNRRAFLQLLCSGAAAAAFPASISRALEIPAHQRTGTLEDVEHIVFLMQENRSFDHYFGTLRGVRGYGDPRAVTLTTGKSVFHQPDGDGYLLPFHPGAPNLGLQFLQDLAHDWTSTHGAWNEGQYDRWVLKKGTTTMAHLTRSDIPYQYALADAFTLCDAYHCSLLGPTHPNRYHMWTGWVGNNGKGGGPAVDNADTGSREDDGYTWSTYPEVLERAGVSWKVYQDIGNGLTAKDGWGDTEDAYVGNYGDSALLFFRNYEQAKPGSPLYEKALTGTNAVNGESIFAKFRKDVAANRLPQVSWIVAPEAYCEHPNWPANYGAWYVARMLDALTANPDVWSRTALFVMYDENDGFFDHMVPPTPPESRAHGLSTVSTVNEIYPGRVYPGRQAYPRGPYGLGVRVPMFVISPWSKGGWVNSQVFDHTSMIRFVEQRFGPHYPGLLCKNITPWRRAVCGDLTSAFNFRSPNDAKVPLPSTVAYAPPDNKRHKDYVPKPPAVQAMPKQEPGTRLARAVPYELHVGYATDPAARTVTLHFRNTGKVAAVFHVRDGIGRHTPRFYTVGPQTELTDTWAGSIQDGAYNLSVYAPNGFFRAFKGRVAETAPVSRLTYQVAGNAVALELHNPGSAAANVQVSDGYTGKTATFALRSGETQRHPVSTSDSFGWYDLTVADNSGNSSEQRFAGHLETGKDSRSDPAIGRVS